MKKVMESYSRGETLSPCPCQSGLDYRGCCGPYHDGSRSAVTAEALMRSRYTAYCKKNIYYITETHDPKTRKSHDPDQAREWAESSEWLGLEIVSVEGGAADDDGSGSALVLEAALALAPAKIRTEKSIRFIFWNNEETGLNGSKAYVEDRAEFQGLEEPPGSGRYPEPYWLGIIQHDMLLFDHGLPVQPEQIPDADIDIEYQVASDFADVSKALATKFQMGNSIFSKQYPAEIGTNMSSTDSWPFRNLTAAISVRENQRKAEIGKGSNPNWHKPTDVPSTYSEADFRLGFNALQMTLGTVAKLAGVSMSTDE